MCIIVSSTIEIGCMTLLDFFWASCNTPKKIGGRSISIHVDIGQKCQKWPKQSLKICIMEFERNSKSGIFEWGILEIGCMPLCRIYLGLVSQPKKNLGGVTREEMLKMAKKVKNGQNKAQRYVQLTSK